MLTAKEAIEKYEKDIENNVNSGIEKACSKFLRSSESSFLGIEAIDYVEKTLVPKLIEIGYKVEVSANRSSGILTSTSSNGDPSIQINISW